MKTGPGDETTNQETADAELDEPWFGERVTTTRRSSAPPPPPEKLGEFLGDELADAWLR